MPPSSQPIASLSSSESAAAISLLALAPGTPPGLSSPSGTPPSGGPSLQPSISGSGDFRAVQAQAQQQLAAQTPSSGQAAQDQPGSPMDSDMAATGSFASALWSRMSTSAGPAFSLSLQYPLFFAHLMLEFKQWMDWALSRSHAIACSVCSEHMGSYPFY